MGILLKEEIKLPVKSEIVEDSSGNKRTYLKGIFLQSEIKNHNNRIYPERVMDREVNRYIREYVNNNRALGELGHPNSPKINLDRVSHKIIELRKDGTNYAGKALIMEELPYGKIAKGLLDNGVSLGVSSRALGSLNPREDGVQEVGEDFTLSTAADIVADPSAPDAFVQGITEGKEWMIGDGLYTSDEYERARHRIRMTPRRRIQENTLHEFTRFLSGIKKKEKSRRY